MTGPLLVIAHEATRTGSPQVLLDLLRFVAPQLEMGLRVELLAGGPLSEPLLAVATPGDPADLPGAVLVNGASAAGELHRFPPQIPTAVYVHEVGDALAVLPPACVAALVDRADRVVCVSRAAERDLVALGVRAERIELLAPVIAERAHPSDEKVADARSMLGAGERTPLFVGCGEAGWRKGADLFIDIARRIGDVDDKAAFAWVGARPRAFGRVLDHDTRLVGLAERLRWVGELEDVRPALAAADVLIMTSREDPQPLTPLEAAVVGTPTVGFAVGGLNDLKEAGAAMTASYPDTAALAALAQRVFGSPELADSLVGCGRGRIEERQSIAVVGPRFLNIVSTLPNEVPGR